MFQKIENNLKARLWNRKALKNIASFQRELSVIVSQHPNQEIIIFPPGLGWQGTMFQRPQHLAQALADQGLVVFYSESETSNQLEGFKLLKENLYLCHVPLKTFEILVQPYVISMTWNYHYAAQFPSSRLIYDYVDHLQAFSGNQQRLAHHHNLLLESAEIVLATSTKLCEQVKSVRPDVIHCPNGVDYDHFSISKNDHESPPIDITQLLHSRSPIIGYIGALARWVDYDLIEKVAKERSNINFLLIGPDHDRTLPRRMLDIPNLIWLGSKTYDDIPAYLQYFDVAMIPFKVNELTHAVSPLKLFEYMAAGKPVIVSPMEESLRYPGVLVANDPQEFSKRLDQALELKSDRDYLKIIQQVAKENTWEVRARQIMRAINDYADSRGNQV